ncbi:MAG: dihydroxyacetone kinase subunit DhaL [Actinomycetaceae bacterium]|nr:dihydroxyacetone kinase subunit DhaL [Actinomycetaceae bacterium]
MATLGTSWAVAWMLGCAQMASEHRVELIELDRAIGDADHGENIDRGFSAVAKNLSTSTYESPAAVLKMVATTLLSTVGGAAGPLLGTAFLRAGKAVGDGPIDSQTIVNMLDAALGGIQARGKAAEGEKTMVDAWAPAVRRAQAAADEGMEPAQVLREAAEAAMEGAESSEPLVATKGRASYLGERSAGHRDPGAQSTALILQEAAKAAEV